MSNKTIPDIIHNISASLKQQSESIFTHKGNIGDSREKELIAFLEKVMPDCYGFSSGEIIDIENNRSHQTDIIIFDKLYSPYFTDSSKKIVAPVDSVFGTIEVKSVLNSNALSQLKIHIDDFNELTRHKTNGFQINPYLEFTATGSSHISTSENNPIFCMFSYDSDLKLDTIVNKIVLDKINVHLIVVLNKFIIVSNNYDNIFSFKQLSVNNIFTVQNEKVISVFILLLQLYLTNCRLVGTNLTNLSLDLIKNLGLETYKLDIDGSVEVYEK
jgi:hypothetical protein